MLYFSWFLASASRISEGQRLLGSVGTQWFSGLKHTRVLRVAEFDLSL